MKNLSDKHIQLSTGIIAIGMCLFLISKGPEDLIVFLASLFLLIICITDTCFSKIHNLTTLSLLLISIFYHFYNNGIQGITTALTGFFCGFSLFFILYLMKTIGGGDLKALAALGSLIGPSAILQVFLYTAIIGGGVALAYAFFSQNVLYTVTNSWRKFYLFLATKDIALARESLPNRRMKFPYATSLTFGFFTYIQLGSLI